MTEPDHPGSPLYPEPQQRHRIHRGLVTPRQEHIFNWSLVVLVLLYVTAWIGALAQIERVRNTPEPVGPGEHSEPPESPVGPAEDITSRIFGPPAPKTTYLADTVLAFLHPLRGESGALQFAPVLPGRAVVSNVPGGVGMIVGENAQPSTTAPNDPGIYKLAVAMNEAQRSVDDISVITLVPLSAKQNGRIGSYFLGNWPFESGGTPKTPRYAAPSGFIQVTPQNENFAVSTHFRLRDFLTKDQFSVWPKYVPLQPQLVDKLELTIQELEKQGIHVRHMTIMSGFRTPRYNAGGGNTQGRANLSRHMYGDASDVFVDNDGNGVSDDLNHDGRVDVRDAEVVAAAAERVEKSHGSLVGGIGVYSACCGHGPFTHIDVRGYRARWRGTGSG
ncbi:MAG: hypothetical protein JO197_05635 [Acidobacteria bacterium]|nr:hypothetical protein [Acidobacteriota bacterium]MBV9475981.1 hypothetical protein [Acidobacteriota bacterium]